MRGRFGKYPTRLFNGYDLESADGGGGNDDGGGGGNGSPPPQHLLVDSDFSSLPLCECGEGLLSWVESVFPDIKEDVTPGALDGVILALSKEFAHRNRDPNRPIHKLNHCLTEVYEDLLDGLTSMQDELARLQKARAAAGEVVGLEEHEQELFIGEELGEDE